MLLSNKSNLITTGKKAVRAGRGVSCFCAYLRLIGFQAMQPG
jgi:hypothetical protein